MMLRTLEPESPCPLRRSTSACTSPRRRSSRRRAPVCSDPASQGVQGPLHRRHQRGRALHPVRRLPPALVLTIDEWLRGEGGETRRQQFENDSHAVTAGTATPEQRERVSRRRGGGSLMSPPRSDRVRNAVRASAESVRQARVTDARGSLDPGDSGCGPRGPTPLKARPDRGTRELSLTSRTLWQACPGTRSPASNSSR
jgi:hypothetical protein